jgi:hypothetical protein
MGRLDVLGTSKNLCIEHAIPAHPSILLPPEERRTISPKIKTAAANRLRLLQLNKDDDYPVIIIHSALLLEELFNCMRSQEKAQTGSGM